MIPAEWIAFFEAATGDHFFRLALADPACNRHGFNPNFCPHWRFAFKL